MKKIVFSMIAVATLLTAGANHTEFIDVSWKAFKTANKLGVDGIFTYVTFSPKKNKAKDLHGLLLGAKISIDPLKIDTGNKARDEKITSLFFAAMKGKTIEGEIVEIKVDTPKSGIFIAKIIMNAQEVLVPLRYYYEFKRKELVATGYIDIFDFSANDALKSINKACYDLHQGKTWNDVNIEFRLKLNGYIVKGVKGLFG